MTNYIELLKDPNLVWEFQYYFGIRRLPPKSAAHNNKSKTTPGISSSSSSNCNGTAINVADGDKNGWKSSNGSLHSAVHGTNSKSAVTAENGHLCGKNGYLKTSESELKQRMTHLAAEAPPTSNEDTSGGTSDSDSGSAQSGENNSGRICSTPNVDYVITRPFWYYLFSFGAALGDEAFYSSFFPFWFWNVDGAVCRRVVMIWVLIMYVGQGLKDVVRWPRPSTPPVIRLEEKWALEYGMPSTHAMVGAAVPFSFLFYTMYRYEYPVILGVIVCSIWCCLVCGSRLYLGMHTVLDIIVGIVLVVFLMVVLIPFIDDIDYFMLTSTYSPPCILSAYILMILFYPDAGHWTPARGDTVVILGVGAGIAIGSWLNYQWGIISGPPMPPPYKIIWPTYEMVGLTMLRTCIGILVVVATRAFFKSITYALACYLLKLDPRDKANWRKMAVELSSKFLTYSAIAFNVTYLSPAVFRFMNIERLTMFTEV